MGRAAYGAAALALMAGLGACGDDPDESATGDPTSPAPSATSSAPPPEPSPSPSETQESLPFSRLQQDFIEADTGRFESAIEFASSPGTRTGSYRIADQAADTSTRLGTPTGTFTVNAITSDGTLYSQVRNDSGEGFERCWLRYAEEVLGAVTDAASDVSFGLPAEVSVILSADQEGSLTTSSLFAVASTVSGKTPGALGLGPDSTARVPIELQQDGDEITGWSADVADLFDAARRSGATLPPELAEAPAGLLTGSIDVTFVATGTPVDVDPPAPELQIPFDLSTTDATLETALERCEGR